MHLVSQLHSIDAMTTKILSPKPLRHPKKTDERFNYHHDFTLGLCGPRSRLFRTPYLIALVTVGALVAAAVCIVFMLRDGSIVPPQCSMPKYEWPSPAVPPPRYHGPPATVTDRFTIILNSYQRPELLQRAVAHYSTCPVVDVIRVIWCEEGLPPNRAEAPGYYSDIKEVRYDIVSNASLNNRFWPIEGVRTEAVLSLDDDIVAPCSTLEQLFTVWQRDPYNMAGFYPRLHIMDQDCKYRYLLTFGTQFWFRKFSLVLTKAAMFHRDYLEFYTNHMDSRVRHHVDTVHNCEDLAMALLVGSTTGRAPTFIQPHRVTDLGKGIFKVKGISSGKKHEEIRSECLNVFAQHYGGALPLVIQPMPAQLRLRRLLMLLRR